MDEKFIPKLRFEFSSSWESKKLKDIIQISKEKYNPDSEKKNYKCIELEHLAQETGLLLGYTDSINQNSIKNKFHEDNILFGKLRPYLKKFYYTNFVGVCSSEIWVFNTNEYSKYIYYLIQTKKFLDISNVSAGSKMPRSDWNFMKNFVFSIPDIKTQKEIANLFSAIDNKIELLEKKYQQYQNFKKYLMQQIFTQKLRFHDFTDDWVETTLDKIAVKIGDGLHSTPDYVENSNYYFINGNNLLEGQIIINDNTKCIPPYEFEKYNNNLNKNTILISINGTIGNLAYYNNENVILGKSAAYIKLNENIEKEYIYNYLKIRKIQHYFSSELTGSTIKNLSLKTLKNTPIIIPSYDEQKIIANMFENIDSKINLINNRLNNIKSFKKGLLQQMFI